MGISEKRSMQKRQRGSRGAENSGVRRSARVSPDTTIDYGPIENQLGYLLRRAQIAVFQDFFARFSEFDIRPAQYSVLTVIERNPGLSQSEVCDALGIRKSNFVTVLDTLVARRLVRRAFTPSDRRSYALHLTDSGEDFVRKLHQTAAKHEQRIVDRIGMQAHRRVFEVLQTLVSTGSDEPATAVSRKSRKESLDEAD